MRSSSMYSQTIVTVRPKAARHDSDAGHPVLDTALDVVEVHDQVGHGQDHGDRGDQPRQRAGAGPSPAPAGGRLNSDSNEVDSRYIATRPMVAIVTIFRNGR